MSATQARLPEAHEPKRAPELKLIRKTEQLDKAPDLEPTTSSLHPGVFKLFAAINVMTLAVFWVTFSGDGEALFMVAISGVYLFMYLITPWVMSRVSRIDTPQDASFSTFLNMPFQTWTGVISGREAMIQVLIIPSAVLFAVTIIAFIIAFARP